MFTLKQRRWLALAGTALILLGLFLVARQLSRHLTTVPVLQARRDLPAGVAIPLEAVAVVQVPAGGRVPGALTAPEQLRDQWTAAPIFAGEFITSRRVGSAPPDRYEAAMAGGAGLLSLPISPDRVLGGILAPGDTVDIYVVEPEKGAALVAGQVLVVDVRNRAAEPTGGGPTAGEPATAGSIQGLGGMADRIPAWVALRVSAGQAPRLMEAVEQEAAVYFLLTDRGDGAWAAD